MYDLVRTSGVQPKILSKQQLTNTIRTIENELRCSLLLLSMTILLVLLLVDSIVAQLSCIFFYEFSYSVTLCLAFGGTFLSTGCTRVTSRYT